MKTLGKKLLCVLLAIITIITVGVFSTTSAAISKKGKYEDYIKYRGQNLQNTYAKIKKGEEVNVLYCGGSVTNGTGATNMEASSWRALVGKWLTDSFPKAKINNINVSYGGTGTYFGVFRFKEEIIPKKPDLIFLEFAINDYYDNQVRPELKEQTLMRFETIVRNLRKELPECDIVTVLITDKSHLSTNRAGNLHKEAQDHEDICIAYDIPSIHIGRALADAVSLDLNSKDWEKYMTDIVHPTDAGYELYFNVIKEYLSNALLNGDYNGKVKKHSLPRQVYEGKLYDGNIQYIDADKDLIEKSNSLGGKKFEYSDTVKLRGFPGGANAKDPSNCKFVVEFTGTELAVMKYGDSIQCFQVNIDGGKTQYAACYNKLPEVLVTGLKPGKHTATIVPVYEASASSTSLFIIGFFSRDETKATAKYDHDKHIFKKYVSNKDATCKKDGTKTAKCSVKGCDKVDTVTDAGTKLAHKYKIKVIKKATDTKDGEGEKTCSVCGRFDGLVVIPKGKTAEDIIPSESSKTESTTNKQEETESDLTPNEGTSSNTTTIGSGDSSQTTNSNAPKSSTQLGLKITLIVVLSLLVISIGVLIYILIKRKKEN